MQPITHKLTQLQYSTNRSGSLKLYRFNSNGYHGGGQFMAKMVRYPDEEITIVEGKNLAEIHMAEGGEVRICNSGDELVFHAKGSEVIYPPQGAEVFWNSVS